MKTLLFFFALLQLDFDVHAQSAGVPGSNNSMLYKDTTLMLFTDKAYIIELKVAEAYNNIDAKSLLTLYTSKNGRRKILQQDSLTCFMFGISLEDYNGDGVKDLLISHEAGGRANIFYYLYLVDKKQKKLVKVKRFENIPNPSPEKGKKIYSYALSGVNYWQYYKINTKNEAVPIGRPHADRQE